MTPSLQDTFMIPWLLILGFIIAGMALLYWGILKGKQWVKVLTFSAGLLASCALGYALGQGWERLRNYDQYVYRFSQYSRHLYDLAERQQITDLTNAVILFERK